MKKVWLLFLFLLVPRLASAHVGYVIDQGTFNAHAGADATYFFSPLIHGNTWILIATVIVAILAVYLLALRIRVTRQFFTSIHDRSVVYKLYIPWILRLSLGIALIGAATHHTLISPLATGSNALVTLELFVGFAFLLGAALLPATLITLILFCVALHTNAYVMGNLEFLGAAVALLIAGSGKPGLDDMIGIRMPKLDTLKPLIPLFLRVSVGGALTFLALYEKVLNPHISEAVVIQYNLTNVIGVSPALWVFGVGIIELIV
ncbi:MAG TPA: hypothetical protein VLB02_00880, partial [Candidatus Paceibacterota bacterium]|nr:hypothetical protein [Candidatus Paceibacterota bacterium]